MTARQREVLAAMEPGRWMSATSVAARCTATPHGALQRLWILEDHGYVERRGTEFALTRKGAELARTLPPPQRKPERRPRAPRPAKPTAKAAPKKPGKRMRRQSFSQKYRDPEGKRYGQLFMVVRVMKCWLCEAGYEGPGHHIGHCAVGAQGGHTAHHVGRYDEDGMIPGGGAAHDLYAGLGGYNTQLHFKRWLKAKGLTLVAVGKAYVERARAIVKAGGFADKDLNW